MHRKQKELESYRHLEEYLLRQQKAGTAPIFFNFPNTIKNSKIENFEENVENSLNTEKIDFCSSTTYFDANNNEGKTTRNSARMKEKEKNIEYKNQDDFEVKKEKLWRLYLKSGNCVRLSVNHVQVPEYVFERYRGPLILHPVSNFINILDGKNKLDNVSRGDFCDDFIGG